MCFYIYECIYTYTYNIIIISNMITIWDVFFFFFFSFVIETDVTWRNWVWSACSREYLLLFDPSYYIILMDVWPKYRLTGSTMKKCI